MRTILDHGQPGPVGQRHQPVHVAQMPPHMAEKQHLCPARCRLGGKIVQVNGQALGHLDKDGLSADSGDGAGHRGQRKAVRQDGIARPHPHSAQGPWSWPPRRGDGKAILRAHQGREFLLKQRSLGHFAGGCVVAVQPPWRSTASAAAIPLRDRFCWVKLPLKTSGT